jgi:hypothetical protein
MQPFEHAMIIIGVGAAERCLFPLMRFRIKRRALSFITRSISTLISLVLRQERVHACVRLEKQIVKWQTALK